MIDIDLGIWAPLRRLYIVTRGYVTTNTVVFRAGPMG